MKIIGALCILRQQCLEQIVGSPGCHLLPDQIGGKHHTVGVGSGVFVGMGVGVGVFVGVGVPPVSDWMSRTACSSMPLGATPF